MRIVAKRLLRALLPVAIVLLMCASAQAAGAPNKKCSSSRSINLFGGSSSQQIPAELLTTLEAPVLAKYGVLRRPSLPSDQIPALSPIGGELDFAMASYYPAYVRELKVLPNGTRYYLVPGFRRSVPVPPVNCLPVELRGKRSHVVAEQRKQDAELVYCIATLGGPASDGGCESFSEVPKSPSLFKGGLLQGTSVHLVPDGVASVRLSYALRAPVADAVSENSYLVTVPTATRRRGEEQLKHLESGLPRLSHLSKARRKKIVEELARVFERIVAETSPTKVEWLDAGGAVVNSMDRPAAAKTLGGTIVPIG